MGTTELLELIESTPGAELSGVAAGFQELALEPRLAAIRRLSKRGQARLFELAGAAEPLTLADFLPDEPEIGVTYIWEGVNTLPVFRRFQKRFTLTDDPGRLAGYNHATLKWLIGPGCFVARPAPAEAAGPVVIDYNLTPAGQPTGWPRVRPSHRGLSRFVYGYMEDFMRRVSADVMVGWAWKKGKPTGNYFVLTRSPETA